MSTPEIRFPCEEDLKFNVIEKFTESLRSHIQTRSEPEVEEIIDIDGVRARFREGWGLVRASNTQPVLVLRFEGQDEETVALYRGLFERLLEKAIKG